MHKTLKTGFAVTLLVLISPVLSWGWQGKVVSVSDGDTTSILHGNKSERIRLFGIDCPERSQDFGERAKQLTSDMVLGKEVEVEPVTKDRRGYTLAILKMDGQILNRRLIEAGLAWVDTRFCCRKECHEWNQLQDHAQQAKVGIWSAPGPIPPWEFKGPSRKALRSHPQTKSKDIAGHSPAELYHGDVVSHIYHAPGCEAFNCKNCIAVFRNKEAALRAGYKPCEVCNP
jgi:endonuclease YncB( thermonuclease family)